VSRGKRPKLGDGSAVDGDREVLALLCALQHRAHLISQLALRNHDHTG